MEDEVDTTQSIGEEDKIEMRESALRTQIERLEKRIQRESYREVMERFGPGPHRVEFEVLLPVNSNNYKNNTDFFTIELAPLHLMPHSIHLFLEQVSHHLWDRSSFIINDVHSLQIGPYEYRNKEIESVTQYFKDTNLDVLSFK